MEQFKLKSIDELDIDFVSKTRGVVSAQEKSEVNIPVAQSNDMFSNEKPANSYFSAPVQNLNPEPTYSPAPERQQAKKPRPLVPIGQSNNPGYTPVGAMPEDKPFIPEINYDETDTAEPSKAKSGKGALAGKIISIVLLAVTVVVFVFGCFLSIFLDNGGTNIGGYCFNTMSGDLTGSNVSPVSKGDLIISKIAESGEYAADDLIAVPSANLSGCDIHIINTVNTAAFGEAELITTDITNSSPMPCTVPASACFGIVKSYVPALGGLLSFAIENAILVCILFVLLAAFWCLLLVLLEKSDKAPEKPKAPKAKKTK